MGRSRTLQHGYGVIWMTGESIERSLAQCLYQQGLCRYGCGQEGFSTVEFRYDVCGLWTTFKYQYPERASDHINVHKGTEKGTEKTQKGHEKILALIEDNPQISIPALANECDISVKSMRLRLDKLKAKNIIRRIGPNKGGYWQVLVTNDKNKSNV